VSHAWPRMRYLTISGLNSLGSSRPVAWTANSFGIATKAGILARYEPALAIVGLPCAISRASMAEKVIRRACPTFGYGCWRNRPSDGLRAADRHRATAFTVTGAKRKLKRDE
jgi:hypothetical protein